MRLESELEEVNAQLEEDKEQLAAQRSAGKKPSSPAGSFGAAAQMSPRARQDEAPAAEAKHTAERERADAAATQRAAHAEKLAKARREAEARRRERLRKLRGAVHMVNAARHVHQVGLATKYGVIGLDDATLALCHAICEGPGVPAGAIALSANAEKVASEANRRVSPATVRARHSDRVAELEAAHGRKVRDCGSDWQSVIDSGAKVILIGIPVPDADEQIRKLRFHEDQHVLCLVPTLDLSTLHEACAPVPPLHIVRALALPPVVCDVPASASATVRRDAPPSLAAALHASAESTSPASGAAGGGDEGQHPRTEQQAGELTDERHAQAAQSWSGKMAAKRQIRGSDSGPSHHPPSSSFRRSSRHLRARPAYCTAVVQQGLAAPLPPLVSALFVATGSYLLDPFVNVDPWPRAQDAIARGITAGGGDQILCAHLDTDISKRLVSLNEFCEDERRAALSLPHADLCAVLLLKDLSHLSLDEASNLSPPFKRAISTTDEGATDVGVALESPEALRTRSSPGSPSSPRRISQLIEALPVPTTEERMAARDVLLPAYQRGLPPVLRAVNDRGKRIRDFHWSSMQEFKEAIDAFADDFIVPELMHLLQTQAPPSLRLLQLECSDIIAAKEREASAAMRRQLDSFSDLYSAMATSCVDHAMRTHVDRTSQGETMERISAAEATRAHAASVKEWSQAADASRLAAMFAQAGTAAHRCPAVGSRVTYISERPYWRPEQWSGEVVRHGRTHGVCAVQQPNTTFRLVRQRSTGGPDHLVRVAAAWQSPQHIHAEHVERANVPVVMHHSWNQYSQHATAQRAIYTVPVRSSTFMQPLA